MAAALLPEFKVAYFSIPKSASTSMKLVLYEAREGVPWQKELDRVHPQFPTVPLRPADIAATDGWWRFTIVRDPIQRLLSSFGNRVHFHRDIEREVERHWRRKLAFRTKYRDLRRRPTPDEFFERLHRYQEFSYSIWHHTTSVTRFIGDDLSIFDRIYRIDNIPQLEEDLADRLGRQITLPREQTDGMKVKFDDLGAAARKAVIEATREDYGLLAQYFDFQAV